MDTNQILIIVGLGLLVIALALFLLRELYAWWNKTNEIIKILHENTRLTSDQLRILINILNKIEGGD